MTYSVDQDQTASVKSGLKLFASILQEQGRYVRQIFAADDFSRQLFQMHFRSVLRVKGQGLKFETE